MRINTELIKRCSSKNLLPEQSKDDILERITHLFLQEHHIRRIENLQCCTNLIALYLYENKIEKIENLEHLVTLNFLYLHKNAITRIENLDMLSQLTVLNLGHNSIHIVEGLEALSELRELYIQYQNLPEDQSLEFNPETIGCLSQSLTLLNVSGNKLKSFSPLKPLVYLENFTAEENEVSDLHDLIDVVSNWDDVRNIKLTGNPVCSVRKYRDNVVVNCLELEELDGKIITPPYRDYLLNWKQYQTLQNLKRESYEVLKPFLETRQFLTELAVTWINSSTVETASKCVHDWFHHQVINTWEALKHPLKTVSEMATHLIQNISGNFDTDQKLLAKCSGCGCYYYTCPPLTRRVYNFSNMQLSSGYWLYVENSEDILEKFFTLNGSSRSLRGTEENNTNNQINAGVERESTIESMAFEIREENDNFTSESFIHTEIKQTTSCKRKMKSVVSRTDKLHVAPYFLRSKVQAKP